MKDRFREGFSPQNDFPHTNRVSDRFRDRFLTKNRVRDRFGDRFLTSGEPLLLAETAFHRLRSRISLARGRRLLQSHNKTHNVRPIVLYMTYWNSGCGQEACTRLRLVVYESLDHTPRSHKRSQLSQLGGTVPIFTALSRPSPCLSRFLGGTSAVVKKKRFAAEQRIMDNWTLVLGTL